MSWNIVAAGGDYLWLLKSNQPNTLAAVELLFQEPPWGETFPEARPENRRGGLPAAALQLVGLPFTDN